MRKNKHIIKLLNPLALDRGITFYLLLITCEGLAIRDNLQIPRVLI